ncbi:Cilia- and flagella-associated protein 57 [Phytophthora citrophthora]|uniref:Cilia- and flagella-associated protein 57 n=1 Tax=Phytophthora citrophthora TaxID=4793 RepID=A0AAD9G4B9_9STRA|nr:Cilia- and flagella-associated protein 57 [Phytophthora citrophthora]
MECDVAERFNLLRGGHDGRRQHHQQRAGAHSSGSVHNTVAFVEESVLVYPCGHNVIIYNLESKEQQFIHGVESNGRGITALAVSPNKRYVAVAEQAERAVVHIHDLNTLRRRKTLTLSDGQADTCVWVAFSGDSKYCVTQGGAPDWILSLWLWEKTKLLACVKASTPQGNAVHQADFSPIDPMTICVSGNGLLKFFRFLDGQLRLQATPLKREPAHFLRHAWVSDDRVVASADSGELWLFEQFEFRQILTPATTGTTGDGSFMNSLLGYSKGFVCGGSGGCVRIYDRSDDGGSREYYKKAKTFRIEGDASTIKDLAISPSEDLLVCSLENNQLYALTLSSTDILKEDAMNFELVSTAFHAPSGNGSCHITGLDTCIRKPLVVTCALDRSVRVWNYLDKSTDILKFFREDALCVAFHPSGLHVAVGFTDKLRMLNVLMDDIRSCREFAIKGCREVRFSNGGQFFAAANNNVVHVYATYTGELLAVLRGHSNRVTALSWKPDDRRLLSCGADGTVLLWSLRGASKVGDGHSQARCSYIDAALSPEGDVAFVTGSDNMLKEVDMATGVARTEHWTGGGGATLGPIALATSQQVLFVGSAEPGRPGMVRLYRLPLEKDHSPPMPALLTGSGQASPGSILSPGQNGPLVAASAGGGSVSQAYTEYHCHDLPVSRLRLSFDNQFLFSAGEDGSLCIFETQNVIGKGGGSGVSPGGGATGSRDTRSESTTAGGGGNAANGSGLPFAEEILVTKSDLEEKNRLMNELKSKVDELTLHNEYQLRLKDLNYKEKIKEVSDKFTAELTQDRQRCGDLQNDKNEMENEYQKKMREMAATHRSEVQELKTTYEAKVEAEKARYAALEQARGEQNTRFEEENHLLVESHTQFLAEMTTEYDQKVAHEQELQAVCARSKDELITSNESLKRALEEDAELEVEELKTKYELKLSDEREATLRLKGENGIMKKKFSALQKDIEDQREEIRSLEEKGKELAENIRGLEKDIQGHKKEIREREETIQDKEKRIYDLKKKNQELEKFKFVLDYKIKELKRQIEPREQEIADMKTQIEEMDAELEQYHKSNAALDLMIGELRLKMDGMQKELNLQAAQVALGKALVRQVQSDLLGCAQLLDNKKALKVAVMALNKKYEDGVTPDAKEPNSQAEYNRQREYLEKEVESLKRKIMKGMAISESELHRLQRENAVLTTQVNELRREFHNVRMQTQEVREAKYKSTMSIANSAVNKKLSVSSEVMRERKEKMREAEFQKDHILQLKDRITELQKTLGGGLKFALTGSSNSPQHRQQQYTKKPVPPSSQRLPPV